MSTAEAVNIAYACALEAHYLGDGVMNAGAIARQLIGVVLKTMLMISNVFVITWTTSLERGKKQ